MATILRNSLIGVATACLLCACQTPMQTGSQCVVEPGFLDNTQKFTWEGDKPVDVVDETGYVSPLVTRALADAAVSELEAKGFAYIKPANTNLASDSDFRVALTLRTRRELVSFETNGSPCQEVDCWERIDPGSATRMDVRTIGFLAADVYYQSQAIWRGWVETTLYPKDRDAADKVIASAIPKLFESFPP